MPAAVVASVRERPSIPNWQHAFAHWQHADRQHADGLVACLRLSSVLGGRIAPEFGHVVGLRRQHGRYLVRLRRQHRRHVVWLGRQHQRRVLVGVGRRRPVVLGSGSSGGSSGGDDGGGDGGDGRVVLDLTGRGINITQASSSNTFYDMAGDGYQHLTAWAGAGNGVLVYDPDGTGQIM